MAYLATLAEPEKRRYHEKLAILCASTGIPSLPDPYSISEDKWMDDVGLWPPVEFGEIYTYLIDTPGLFTREKLKAYKSLDAYNYYIRQVYMIIYIVIIKWSLLKPFYLFIVGGYKLYFCMIWVRTVY